ncbi:hypothetical protein BSF38_01159 [Paludisphaera borealis]|uniref:Uncharacterized protein n=2 Tax=Paludisphaera borealis TaxID=1387353 RepID=A0A1U7CLE4_9BACT|nr:hypothetical protein BSF38_01159 [Paludisphaera borealis]
MIPLMACLCDGLMGCYNAPGTKASQLVISVSPWLPQLVAVLGCAVLWVKETRLGASSALRWNWAAVVVVVLFGGFLVLVCVIPIVQTVHGLGNSRL